MSTTAALPESLLGLEDTAFAKVKVICIVAVLVPMAVDVVRLWSSSNCSDADMQVIHLPIECCAPLSVPHIILQ